MGKSTRPIYRDRTVKTGHTVVGDMLQWAPRMGSATYQELLSFHKDKGMYQ